MRLMGIGSIVEQQADMFLCDPLTFYNREDQLVAPKRINFSNRGDVLVTNPLPSSVHILTMDYLLHLSPCCMYMKEQALEFSISNIRFDILRHSFSFVPLRTTGGSPVIKIKVGGEIFECTMDTGAPGSVSLGIQASERLKRCKSLNRSVTQRGVNGETICSSIISTDVSISGVAIKDADIFINDTTVDHTDGYVGLGFLRSFDIMITGESIGFRQSGLSPRYTKDFPSGNGACTNINLKCEQ